MSHVLFKVLVEYNPQCSIFIQTIDRQLIMSCVNKNWRNTAFTAAFSDYYAFKQ